MAKLFSIGNRIRSVSFVIMKPNREKLDSIERTTVCIVTQLCTYVEGVCVATNRKMVVTSIVDSVFHWYDEVIKCIERMFTLSTADALDYTAVFEDAAEELHILGKLVPPHHQYTGSSDEVSNLDRCI
jgi:hypothetical protein